MTINIMQLATMKEIELNKMTKAELVAAIQKDAFYPSHYKSEAEKLRAQLSDNASNERAACVVLAAFVGEKLDRNEYSGEIDSKKLNILELAGLVAAKCASAGR